MSYNMVREMPLFNGRELQEYTIFRNNNVNNPEQVANRIRESSSNAINRAVDGSSHGCVLNVMFVSSFSSSVKC